MSRDNPIVLILWESKREIDKVFVFNPDEVERAKAHFTAYSQQGRAVTMTFSDTPEELPVQPDLFK